MKTFQNTPIKVLILGGGFGGVETALRLDLHSPKGLFEITLLTQNTHFEYTPALYRVVTGKSPEEVCIPLKDKKKKKKVRLVFDTATEIHLEKKRVVGMKKEYVYDFLVVALGSEPAFFDIEGLSRYALGFKSIKQALALKKHLHEKLEEHVHVPKHEIDRALHVDVVGAGPAGVELAGELSNYLKKLALKHSVSFDEIKIDLIEASPRLTPMMSEKVSQKVALRLTDLGVHCMPNTKVVSTNGERIMFENGSIDSKTLVWTAGVQPHILYRTTKGWQITKQGRVVVDTFLRAKGYSDVFIIGDGADTYYSGTAQTALYDGAFVARTLRKIARIGKPHLPYYPRRSAYIIPVGPGWAIFTYGNFVFSGKVVWWLREMIELRFFLSVLPFTKAWRAWRSGVKVTETCKACEEA